MIWFRAHRTLALCLVTVLLTSLMTSPVGTVVYAATLNQNSDTAAAPVTINPNTLKKLLLEKNIALMIQLNKVYQAKEQVNLSRSQLLPSINLGTMISSGPSFALSSISMLLPFLLPSKWFDLTESQYLLSAQATSYYISQLNTFSSAYSVYLTVVGDMELRDVIYKQYSTYRDIEQVIALAVEAGMMNQSDLLQAQAQTQLAGIQVSQLDDLLQKEKAAFRDMLALPLSQEIVFEKTHMAPSNSESLPAQTILDQASAKAPEILQLNNLISAANTSKWSKAFSFLSGSSLSSTRSSNGALSPVAQIGTINLGFGYFPSLNLTDYNIDELKLQKKQLSFDQAQMIEATLGSLTEASKQYSLATLAEQNLNLVYQGELEKFRAGMTDLLHVLNAGNSLTVAMTNKVKAQTNLDTLRVSLNRITLDDVFAKINACEIQRKSSGGFKGRLGRIFNPNKDQISLDEACGPQTVN